MTEFRRVTEDFAVAPQIVADDVARAAEEGYVLVINNRPDGEVPGQTPEAEVARACEGLGLGFVSIPFVGPPSRAQAEAVLEAIDRAGGPVLAYCRSGTRCINVWALGQAMSGRREPEELVRLGFQAGYDLRPLFG